MDYSALNPLSYAVRPRAVLKYLGQLTLVMALLNLVPALAALLLGEYRAALPYALVSGLAAGPAWLASRLREPRQLQSNEALVITALAF
ncbi:MAG: TrkH family potassium uptake protein, partial [Candidatus Competibacteraceae bacterium]|nr:TrkH family potassium uptake protein [Candidatus Competibacteraceae bacterium]